MEMQVDSDAGELLMARGGFYPIALAERLHLDEVGVKNVPPLAGEKKIIDGRPFAIGGCLLSHGEVDNYQLPDPDSPHLYEAGRELIRENKGNRAVFTKIRLGLAPAINSMGLAHFCTALGDQPDLVERVMNLYADWQIRVLERLHNMAFDFFWAADDLAYKTGPFISPGQMRDICFPIMKRVAVSIEKPWVFHSDGNLWPVMDDLLSLGMNAIHPIEPQAMNIVETQQKIGDRVCLVGNIDLDTVLCRGSLEDVDKAVRYLIANVSENGGHIISSSNTIPSYARPENVIRLGEAVRQYGRLLQ